MIAAWSTEYKNSASGPPLGKGAPPQTRRKALPVRSQPDERDAALGPLVPHAQVRPLQGLHGVVACRRVHHGSCHAAQDRSGAAPHLGSVATGSPGSAPQQSIERITGPGALSTVELHKRLVQKPSEYSPTPYHAQTSGVHALTQHLHEAGEASRETSAREQARACKAHAPSPLKA